MGYSNTKRKSTSRKIPLPLKWHGGKYYLARRIIQLMPQHIHYVEPYFGGGAVLLNKDPNGVSEVVNDIYGRLTNFWKVLQNKRAFGKFQRIVSAIPFSQAEWNERAKAKRQFRNELDVNTAVDFFIHCRQSRAGLFKDFTTLSRNRITRNMNEQASAWLNAIEGLPAVHARLKRVVVLQSNALKVIKSQDGTNTCFYLDPPYLHQTRISPKAYSHEMAYEDHEKLLDLINQVEGKVLISGYISPLYNRKLKHWRHKTFDLPNNAACGKKKRRMTERVWMNY